MFFMFVIGWNYVCYIFVLLDSTIFSCMAFIFMKFSNFFWLVLIEMSNLDKRKKFEMIAALILGKCLSYLCSLQLL